MRPIDWDVRTGKVTRTPQLEANFGVHQGIVKGHYSEFRKWVHPDDTEAVETKRDAAVRRSETFNLEFRVIRPNGQVRWIVASGGAFYDEATGEPTRILGNNVGVTERKGGILNGVRRLIAISDFTQPRGLTFGLARIARRS